MLGSGTMGHVVAQGEYAVKVYRDRRSGETKADFKERVSYEYTVLKQLHHPHIIRVKKLKTKPWLQTVKVYMELGDPNYWRPLREPLTPLEVLRQVVDAVQYLHKEGWAHRDLKLENTVLVHGRVVLIDFATATNRPGMGLVGLGQYVAPEQYTSIRYDAFAADIWLIGIMYWMLMTDTIGRPPWKTAHIDDVDYKFYLNDPRIPNNALLARLLSPNPSSRPLIDELKILIAS